MEFRYHFEIFTYDILALASLITDRIHVASYNRFEKYKKICSSRAKNNFSNQTTIIYHKSL